MRIDQVIAGASSGDAVTNLTLMLRDTLRTVVESDVFAGAADEDVRHEVKGLDALASSGDGPVIYHCSIGCPPALDALARARRPIILVYHNITPAEFFEGWDPSLAALTRRGREELRLLRPFVMGTIADSSFNADELLELGYRDVEVIPPIMNIDRLVELPGDATTDVRLADEGGPLFVFVGQLLPHKQVHQLIEAAHVLATYRDWHPRVAIIGAGRHQGYTESLRRLARHCNLENVRFVGKAPDAVLASYLRAADVFVTLTGHEGFCLPVVEAMRFGTPVLARAVGALPETVGNAGLLLAPSDGPVVAAEAMWELADRDRLRHELITRGHRHSRQFEPDRVLTRHVAAIEAML